MKPDHATRMKMHIDSVFARNLSALCDGKNISHLCEAIGINRTQFNKMRSGASQPRPDSLKRIYQHFGYDARILDTPVAILDAEAKMIESFRSRCQEAKRLVHQVINAMDDVDGLAGFHLNGDLATWEDVGVYRSEFESWMDRSEIGWRNDGRNFTAEGA